MMPRYYRHMVHTPVRSDAACPRAPPASGALRAEPQVEDNGDDRFAASRCAETERPECTHCNVVYCIAMVKG